MQNVRLRRPLLTWILFVTTLVFLGMLFSIFSFLVFCITCTVSAVAAYLTIFIVDRGSPKTRYAGMVLFTGLQIALLLSVSLIPFLASNLIPFVSALGVGIIVLSPPSSLSMFLYGRMHPRYRLFFSLAVLVFGLGFALLFILFADASHTLQAIATFLAISTPLALFLKLGFFTLCIFLSTLPIWQSKQEDLSRKQISLFLSVMGIFSTVALAALAFFPGFHMGLALLALPTKIGLVILPLLLAGLGIIRQRQQLTLATHASLHNTQLTHLQELGFLKMRAPYLSAARGHASDNLEQIVQNKAAAFLHRCCHIAADPARLNSAVGSAGHIKEIRREEDYLLDLEQYVDTVNQHGGKEEEDKILRGWFDAREEKEEEQYVFTGIQYDIPRMREMLPSLALSQKNITLTPRQKIAFCGFLLESQRAANGIEAQERDAYSDVQKPIAAQKKELKRLKSRLKKRDKTKKRKQNEMDMRMSNPVAERSKRMGTDDHLIEEVSRKITRGILSKIIQDLPEGSHIFIGDSCYFTKTFIAALQNASTAQEAVKEKGYFSLQEEGLKYARRCFYGMLGVAISLIGWLGGILLIDMPYLFLGIAGLTCIPAVIAYSYHIRSEAAFGKVKKIGSGLIEIATDLSIRPAISTSGFFLGALGMQKTKFLEATRCDLHLQQEEKEEEEDRGFVLLSSSSDSDAQSYTEESLFPPDTFTEDAEGNLMRMTR